MRPPRDRRPRFVLDQNFPAPILSVASLDKWLPEIEIVSVRDHDARLSRDYEDWQVILGSAQLQAEGFISDDDDMLDNPRVIAVVDQLRLSLVVCEINHDPIARPVCSQPTSRESQDGTTRTGPRSGKSTPTEQRPREVQEFKDRIERNSGGRVDNYRLAKAARQEPLRQFP